MRILHSSTKKKYLVLYFKYFFLVNCTQTRIPNRLNKIKSMFEITKMLNSYGLRVCPRVRPDLNGIGGYTDRGGIADVTISDHGHHGLAAGQGQWYGLGYAGRAHR